MTSKMSKRAIVGGCGDLIARFFGGDVYLCRINRISTMSRLSKLQRDLAEHENRGTRPLGRSDLKPHAALILRRLPRSGQSVCNECSMGTQSAIMKSGEPITYAAMFGMQ